MQRTKFALVFLLIALFLCVSLVSCEETQQSKAAELKSEPTAEHSIDEKPIEIKKEKKDKKEKEEDEEEKKKYTLTEFFSALKKKMVGKDVFSIILHELEIAPEDEKIMTQFFAENQLNRLQNIVVSKLDTPKTVSDPKKIEEERAKLNKFLISFFTTIQKFQTIETITVAKTTLQDPEVVKALATLISNLPQLKAVFFFKNGMTPATLKILNENFNPKFDNQFKLSFNKNFIEDEGLKTVMEMTKRTSKNVKKLTLRNIGITESGATTIAEYLKSDSTTGLNSLHIAENRISEVGYQHIAEAAAATKFLKRFKISQAGQGSASFEKKTVDLLGEIISKNLCNLSGSLALFDLKYNTFTKESSGGFVDAIKSCEALLKSEDKKKKAVLDISENVIPKKALTSLIDNADLLEKILPKIDEKQLEEERKKKAEEKTKKAEEKAKKAEEKQKRKEEKKKLPKEERHKKTQEQIKLKEQQRKAEEEKKAAKLAEKIAKRPAFTLIMRGVPMQSRKLKSRLTNLRVLETDYSGQEPKEEKKEEQEEKEEKEEKEEQNGNEEDNENMMKDFEELLGQTQEEEEKPEKSEKKEKKNKRDEL